MKSLLRPPLVALLACAFLTLSTGRGDLYLNADLQASARVDEASPEVKRSNAELYTRQIDLALSILGSETADPLKKRLLHNVAREARNWKNARLGESSSRILGEIDSLETLIDGNHFWILHAELVAAKVAVENFL